MSLLSTKNVADLPARIQRFRMRMMCFTYTISHVPGRDLYTSEALSRAPIVRPLKQEEEKQTDDAKAYVDSVIKRVPASEDGLEELRSQQQQDEVTQSNSSPIVLMVGPRNPTFSPLKACWPERGEMTVQQGLLERLRFTFTPNGKREFVPRDQVFPLFFVYCLLLLHKNK